MKNIFLISISLLVIGVFGRIIPHPPNFTPIGGIIIFSILKLENKVFKNLMPLFVFWVSDLIINNILIPYNFPQYYQGFTLIGSSFIYLALIVIIVSLKFYIKHYSKHIILGSSFISAALFFLITNFGVWLGSSIYPPNFLGFLICLGAGVPFFGNNLLSTVIYSFILIKGYELAKDISLKKYLN
jgi:hypothetical protein